MGERALVPPSHPSSAAPVEPHVYPSPCRAVGLGGQINSYWTRVFYLAFRPHTSFQQCRISIKPYSYLHPRKTKPFQVLPAWVGPSFAMALPLRARCCFHLLNPMLADLGKTLHFPSWTRMLCISPSGQSAHPLPHPSSATQHLLSPEDPAPALLPPPRWYAVMEGGAALLLSCSW